MRKQRFCKICSVEVGAYMHLCDKHKKSRRPDYKHVKDFRVRNKERALGVLGGRCVICGYDKCKRALQFHHLDPSVKSFTVSQNLNKAWAKIESELKKCVLLCANCHMEVEDGLKTIPTTKR